ncbi:MAG: ChpI protein [Actinobacteria bacterium]|jgi:metal-responsive CopG/Arc/MetJ family transcriptional regulator|nr:ChpI protein [Actinomycetota bacterium]
MKIAVSIPDTIFEAADRLAARRKISRSELYAEALSRILDAEDADDITARLDAVYGDIDSGLDADLGSAQADAVREDW